MLTPCRNLILLLLSLLVKYPVTSHWRSTTGSYHALLSWVEFPGSQVGVPEPIWIDGNVDRPITGDSQDGDLISIAAIDPLNVCQYCDRCFGA
jgi:hypothetical protein